MAYKQPIGYFNHNQFPVQFTLRSGRSAPMQIDAGLPITANGKLLPHPQEELNEEVRMGVIQVIYADNPKHAHFLKWNAQAEQRSTVRFADTAKGVTAPDAVRTSVSPSRPERESAPDITVSASHPPVPTSELGRGAEASGEGEDTGIRAGEPLEQWVDRQQAAGRLTLVEGGKIRFNGQTFGNKKALAKYLELQAQS